MCNDKKAAIMIAASVTVFFYMSTGVVKLTAGEKFPDNTNHNRQWTYKRKP
jgi:hypothetical protein